MTSLLTILLLTLGQAPAKAIDQKLLTIAESSNFKATSRHAEVVSLCEALAKAYPKTIRVGELGISGEGRKLPLLIVADPPIPDADAARRSGKLVVFAMGNIHAGEVCGKEALPMLARDIASQASHPLLKNLILVFAPIYNADGNERMSRDNRPGQVGPEMGMGIRFNSQGLDLNRDFIKLECPETKSLVRFLNKWAPAILIDCHTTNGSYHRYAVTYDVPRHPIAGEKLTTFARDVFVPEIAKRFEAASGQKTFYYGNFNRDKSRWEMYGNEPRYSTQYFAARKRIGVLCEAYAYLPYKDRIFVTRDFVRAIADYAAEHTKEIRAAIGESLTATSTASTAASEPESTRGRLGAGRRRGGRGGDAPVAKQDSLTDQKSVPREKKTVAIRTELAKTDKQVAVLGYVEESKDGKRKPTGKPKDYPLEAWVVAKATLVVDRPAAYVFPAKFKSAVQTLQRHGVVVQEIREDLDVDAEVQHIKTLKREARAFQKHHTVDVATTSRTTTVRIPAGSMLVETSQPLGDLAAFMLEPQSEDGLTTWNFFDDGLAQGADFPVLRAMKPTPMLTTAAKPLPEDERPPQAITAGMGGGFGGMRALSGSPVLAVNWIDDEHFTQVKQGKTWKIEAATGKAEPYVPKPGSNKLAESFAKIPTLGINTGRGLAGAATVDSTKVGAFAMYESDLYYGKLDGSFAARLTKTPGEKDLVRFSPDGKYVSFVRQGNLYVVDVATQSERALTTDGTGDGTISNGKTDWVYYEEINNRDWNAYWWSPDSSRIAFLRFDDHGVLPFTVVNHLRPRQTLEVTAYPKSGDPNPTVTMGIVTAAGGPIKFVDLSDYNEFVVQRVGWFKDSSEAFCFVLNRQQTWLDFNACPIDGSKPRRLFRETTKAWVDDPGDPIFLADGTFLLPLERTGWKHLYHFDRSGKLKKQVTDGEWEVRSVVRTDEKAGYVYFMSTAASHTAENLYRVKLAGGTAERLTTDAGRHGCAFSPSGKYFLDTYSNHKSPGKTGLRSADGKLIRAIDTNPVHALSQYRLGEVDMVKIHCKDGYELDGLIVKPPKFDPTKKYPVWFMTYGGPHTSTVFDSWSGGRASDQMLANLGIVVFRFDPRSASGRGAVSTWSCYKQLGVQELKDIEDAIDWLCQHSWIDPSRIGMAGHSYGGFMTAYALTHSKKFCAGIAGAPVTDWRNYDSIYTERYMDTPQNNPDGYAKTSVVRAARNLHGRLLLLHGAVDDNVHVQNSIQLIQALQLANKDFDMMLYPTSRHGIFGQHYTRLMHEFILKNLKVPEPAETTLAGRVEREE